MSYSINLKQRKNIIGILALFFVFLKNWIFLNIKKRRRCMSLNFMISLLN
nr:MAG TPA: hypothetical protein [Caudoviricetes sp.]